MNVHGFFGGGCPVVSQGEVMDGTEKRGRRAGLTRASFMPLYLSVFLVYGFNNTVTSAFSGYIDYLGGDMLLAGLQNSLFIVLAVALRFVLGLVADRRGARVLLIGGAASFLVPCLALPFCDDVGVAVALRAAQAIGLAAYHPNVAFYLTEHSSREDAARRISATRFLAILSLMVVPVALFPVIDVAGYGVFFAVLSLLALVGFTCVVSLPRRREGADAARRAPAPVRGGEKGAGFARAVHEVTSTGLLPLVAMPAALSAGYGAVLVFAPVAVHIPGGAVLSAVSMGGLLGSVAAAPLFRRFGAKGLLSGFTVLFTAGMTGLSLPIVAPVVSLVAAAFLGIGYFGATTLLVSALGDRLKSEEGISSSGSIFAAQQNFLDIGMVLGSAVSGAALSFSASSSCAFGIWAVVAAAGVAVFCVFYNDPFKD